MTVPPQQWGTLVRFYIEARDSAGNVYSSPAPIRKTIWEFYYGSDSISSVPQKPSDYSIMQNYPNPFNPTTVITTIPFHTPTPVSTEIAIYNILGQKIKTIFSGLSYVTGNSVTWDGKNEDGLPAPSGLYLCRMTTPFHVSSSKIMLLR